jgi:methionyl-tRNA formyltransferase
VEIGQALSNAEADSDFFLVVVGSQIKANEKGDALVITCDDGSQLEVLELQPPGKKVVRFPPSDLIRFDLDAI